MTQLKQSSGKEGLHVRITLAMKRDRVRKTHSLPLGVTQKRSKSSPFLAEKYEVEPLTDTIRTSD